MASLRSRQQGWCSGESARPPPMCPGFDSRTQRHMWTEFVGSLLCSKRFFSRYSGFPPLLKNQHLIWFDWFDLQSPQLVKHLCLARMIWDLNKVIILLLLYYYKSIRFLTRLWNLFCLVSLTPVCTLCNFVACVTAERSSVVTVDNHQLPVTFNEP